MEKETPPRLRPRAVAGLSTDVPVLFSPPATLPLPGRALLNVKPLVKACNWPLRANPDELDDAWKDGENKIFEKMKDNKDEMYADLHKKYTALVEKCGSASVRC